MTTKEMNDLRAGKVVSRTNLNNAKEVREDMAFIARNPSELDDTDVILLLALIQDARTSTSQLAQKVGLSDSATAQRVARLEKAGIIKNYKLQLNHKAFPVQEFDINYKLTDVSQFTIDQAMKYLSECVWTTQVLHVMGEYDIRVTMLARNMQHLNELLQDIEQYFSSNIRNRIILAVTRKFKSQAQSFLSTLFGREIVMPQATRMKEVYEKVDVTLDDTDRQLIAELAKDPRASYATLSKSIALSSEAISNRIKSLEERGIILAYRALLDGPRLGFRWAVIQINMRHITDADRDKIIAFVTKHPNVSSAVELLGDFNLSVTVFGETLDALRGVELDFRSQFGDAITDTNIQFILSNHKYPDVPLGLIES